MPSEMRLWQIRDNEPKRIEKSSLDFESRLEDWLRDDIGMVSDDLLVIGQQVQTAFGGVIDLLAIKRSGDLVILELKKDRTPRDIVAQALDYASWVQGMGHADVVSCASEFFGKVGDDKTLEQKFRDKFGEGLPEVVNEKHSIYVVASSLDPATERIIEFLSETHGVDINAATFAYFRVGGDELVGCSMLLDEVVVRTRAETRGASRRRRPNSTEEELREVARENGVVELWDRAIRGLSPLFPGRRPTFSQSTMGWYARTSDASTRAAIFTIIPSLSSSEYGLVLRVRQERIAEHFGVSECEVKRVCGTHAIDLPGFERRYPWWGDEHFFDSERLDELIALLSRSNVSGP